MKCATAPTLWWYQYVNALPEGPVHFHYPGPSVVQDFGPEAQA
jgi:hypothetical protein